MALINGCEIPEDLFYEISMHVWVRFEADGAVTLGMTDPAQTRAGKLQRLTVKKPGKQLRRGDPAAVLESAKWVGPFPAPLSGEVVEANADAVANPALVNRDLYGSGWIVRLRPTRLGEERGFLVTGSEAVAAYRAAIEAQQINCIRCADPA